MEYEPEVGQSLFGNDWYDYAIPDFAEELLSSICEELKEIYGENWQWKDIKISGIEIHPYRTEDERPNFTYKGVKIKWYKHFGRGMSCNKEMNLNEWTKWANSCLNKIKKEVKDE